MIETKGLTKRFNGTIAVDDLNLAVKQGEIFAFLGPNGADKTTTTRMLACLIAPTRGQARVAQQIGGRLVIPAVVLGIAQTAGFILLNAITFIVGAVVIALIDVGILYLAMLIFQREKILTQWK